jgi:DNA-binding NarL/FixJ family response regulator
MKFHTLPRRAMSMRQIRVLLVEDHPVVLRGLRALVAEYEDFEVVGEAPTAEEAVAMAGALRPDVTVLPVRLGGTHSGIELCRTIKSVSGARVVVFTSFTRTVDVQIAMLAGADALVSKTAASESFISALRQVTVGGQALVLGPVSSRPPTRGASPTRRASPSRRTGSSDSSSRA